MIEDSAIFTPSGRRLLAALGILDPDPLLGRAAEWSETHTGPMTPALRHVRARLAETMPPPEIVESIEAFKATPWKGPLA